MQSDFVQQLSYTEQLTNDSFRNAKLPATKSKAKSTAIMPLRLIDFFIFIFLLFPYNGISYEKPLPVQGGAGYVIISIGTQAFLPPMPLFRSTALRAFIAR